MNRFWLSFSLLALTTSAHACLNDRDSDSLAVQAAKFPDTLRVISGRFERNPPLFYQMRIRRSLGELKRNPRQFGLYDDIAVAFDRLHRDDEALQIMAKKRALLPPFDAKNPTVKEAWYRYYANAGTFRAHRWLGAGAKVQTIGEMKQARDFISRAIEIKPNAHFGRERYQLMTMDWILAVKTKKTTKNLSQWIEKRDGWEDVAVADDFPRRQRAIEGLSGLVVLGAAWESVDIFEALAYALQSSEGAALGDIALLRCAELFRKGRVSLAPETFNEAVVQQNLQDAAFIMVSRAAISPKNQKTLNELFPKLRAEAENWDLQRQKYMLTRLERGRHPDWDGHFWDEWKPAAPPSLDVEWFNEKQDLHSTHWQTLGVGIVLVSLLLFGPFTLVWLLDRFFSRRRRLT